MGIRRLSRTGRSKALQESCACAADSVSQRAHTKPLTLGENHFPADTLIVPVIQSVHRQPDVYDALESFRPERFLHPRQRRHRARQSVRLTSRCCAFGSHRTLLETFSRVDPHSSAERLTPTLTPGSFASVAERCSRLRTTRYRTVGNCLAHSAALPRAPRHTSTHEPC
jgi:Cytochrome P450